MPYKIIFFHAIDCNCFHSQDINIEYFGNYELHMTYMKLHHPEAVAEPEI